MTPSRFACALVVLSLAGSSAWAQGGYPYYAGQWYQATAPGGQAYYYANYYYGPSEYHHACYYPYVSKRYVYYYNWKARRYWGRYDFESAGYSLLPEDKRLATLSEIKEEDFPEPQALDQVTIPGTSVTMKAPPPLPRGK
jgi:hypothetical protein